VGQVVANEAFLKMMDNWSNISRERAAAIRAEVEAEVEGRVRAELEPVIREQAEAELWERAREEAKKEAQEAERARKQAREEARRELAQEHKAGAPSERLRRGFVEFVRETEIDAHAQATVASGSAERTRSKLKWSRRTLGSLPWMLFAGAVPLLYVAWLWAGGWVTPAFIAASASLLVAFLAVLMDCSRRHGRLEREAERLEGISSDYLILAERAKTFRLVHAERLETKGRLDELTFQLQGSKENLDQRFHPSVEELDVARESARHRIEVVEAPSAEQEFDERLAEAEAAESERARV
jgi:hypothetical protein